MKSTRKTMRWVWIIVAILLVGLAVLAWVLFPGLHNPASSFTSPSSTSWPVPQPVEVYWPTDGWRTSTPEQQGFDSELLADGLQDLKKSSSIDSLLIIRNGYVILDAYFYPYDGSFPHDLASITKSVTTTLVAIAAEQGKLQLDQPMINYFPTRTIANLDDFKKSITVRNLTGMVNGMESGCLNGDEPTLNTMRSQPDWIQAALDRKMVGKPGLKFCYDSPGMHLLSAILQETTGMTEEDFARKHLFEPLGIREASWESDPQGYSHGWGDLHLKPGDAARIGYLFLNGGTWESRQIVPAAWVAEATSRQSKTGQRDNYGYGWWVSDDSYFALGRSGQHIKIYPALNAIVVTTAGSLEYSEIDRVLNKAFVDAEKPLPPNPEGTSRLDALLPTLLQGPAYRSGASIPETAQAVSGNTYICEPNEVNLRSIQLKTQNANLADLVMNKDNMDVTWPIGLDGKYRLSPDGAQLRGYWEDSQTFSFDIFDIGLLTRKLKFVGDDLDLIIPEAAVTLKCQLQIP